MPGDDLYWNSVDFGSDESLPEEMSSKRYVDPWDLENYAYIREHLDSLDLGSNPSNTSNNSLYYVPREQSYAAIEEIVPTRRHHIPEFDSDLEENPYEEHMKDTSLFYVPDKDVWRKAPKSTRDRSLSFSYGDYNSKDIYSRLDNVSPTKDTLPIYDDVPHHTHNPKPRNFGLSNYGHLKIDYSYSWNNLDKYICH